MKKDDLSSPKVISIMGPTASGKTALALAIAKLMPVEIISVDSAMIYRGMDIGTAKPTPEEIAISPHHLIDIRDPSEPYSAADFALDAEKKINSIQQKNKTPLLVGGTMLYFRALQQGLSSLPPADPTVREEILKEAERIGWAELHKKLEAIDPVSAKRIHPNDPQRLQRALEVYYLTKKPMSSHFIKPTKTSHRFFNIALIPQNRDWLHQKITERFLSMLEAGFLNEVEKLYKQKNLNLNLPSIRSVGYRQAWQHLAGEIDEETMIKEATAATRQLAKRQLTWLRSWPNLDLTLDPCHNPDSFVEEILKQL